MRKSTITVVSAAVFSLLGMLAGYLGRGYDVPACAIAGLFIGFGVAALAIGVEDKSASK